MRFRAVFLAVLFFAPGLSTSSFAQTISGFIRDTDGHPVIGAVEILDSSGDLAGHYWMDPGGNFQSDPLADGTYYAVTLDTTGMLDEAWNNIPCENRLCDVLASTPITVSSSGESNIFFVLEPITSGGHISGQVLDGSDVPLRDILVQIRNSNGEFLAEYWTDPAGN
jgi:hypothetical protein